MKIRTQFFLSMVLFSMVLLFVAASFLFTAREVSRLEQQELIGHSVVQGATDLGYLVNDYLLYREPQQRIRWEAKLAELTGNLQLLDTSGPELTKLAENLNANRNALQTVFADIAATVESNPLTDPAARLAFTQVSWSRLQVPTQAIVFDATHVPEIFEDRIDEVQQRELFLVIAILVLIAGYFGTTYAIVQRRTLRCLEYIQSGVNIVGSGNLDYVIPPMYDDEVGALAKSFNRMTVDLKGVTASKADLEREVIRRAEVEEELKITNEHLQENTQRLKEEIADRKAAEEAIRLSEEKYRNLFSSMNEGFALHEIILDKVGKPYDYRFLDVNTAFERLTGLSASHVTGRTVREVIPAIELSWIERYGKVALTGLPVRFENYAAPLNRWYETYAYSPGKNRFAAVFTDITERKHAEEALKESESKYRTLFEQSASPVLVADAEGHYIDANQSALDYLECSREELRQKHVWDFIPPGLENRQKMEHTPFIDHRTVETSYLVHGRIKTLLLSVSPVNTGGHQVLYGIGQDITERKRTEQMKDEFIGMISHELKTPLTVIIGALSTAAMEGLSEDLRRELFKDAVNHSAILTGIVDNLLELSRQQSDRLDLHKEPTEIDQLCEKVLQQLKNRSDIHQLICDVPGGLPQVPADPLRVERILYNLVENAIKYSPKGGEVKVTAEQQNGNLVVSVSDQGLGISPENQAKLFQKFERLGAEVKGAIQGTGLGLRVCRILTEAHGGRIWVESEPGQGTTFYFTLPLTGDANGNSGRSAVI
ncbi:ATP-binding protein [Dehalogenimonas sp. THU2]|uniref:ATP-binding protein n=1 Tax=Dehalogenimonas sp. THU2 TaxID=3151121 RepID=UPI00321856E6